MKERYSARKLALAAVGGGISLLGVTLAFYIPNLSLTFNIFASFGLMLPLSQKYYRESIIAYVAVAILGSLYTNIHILPFAMVTGAYSIFAIICHQKSIKPYISYVIGFFYSLIVFFIMYKLTTVIYVDLEKFKIGEISPALLYVALNVVFSAAFLAYHYLIVKVFLYLSPIFRRIIKKN